ncbi:UNVERIFIED_CONTAM: hypothetical protein H355_014454 [Colinus virginianus]|nr:hypothetical protein H355_014454 [Colinus virginianus]
MLPLSPWSEWTPCSPCLPLSPSHPGDVTPLVSMQHRYRSCLDPQSGQPWSGDAAVCSAELQQQRLCPDPDICQGCRCPQGQLLQDGLCVPTAQCRCGLSGDNGTQELWPGQEATIECHNCTCENGTMVCPALPCPSYGPWSSWSPCSSSCGSGRTSRHRTCEPRAGGVPCTASMTQETAECSPQPCPGECPASLPPLPPVLRGVGTDPCPPQPAAS